MLRIGDFSKLSPVSVETLRSYDQVGLLRPARVDPLTGYRHYSAGQLPRLHRILALKDLGLSLSQIAEILDEGLTAGQLRGMLRLKQAELHQRLARVEARLRQIEQEDLMPDYEVVLKAVEPQLVASVQGNVANYPDSEPVFDRLFDDVYGYVYGLGVRRVGCGIALYHDPDFRDQDMTVEAAAPIYQSLPGN